MGFLVTRTCDTLRLLICLQVSSRVPCPNLQVTSQVSSPTGWVSSCKISTRLDSTLKFLISTQVNSFAKQPKTSITDGTTLYTADGIGTLRTTNVTGGRDRTWHVMTWHDMTWQDVSGRDMTWLDMMWHDMAWCEMTWNDVTWPDLTRNDATWREMMWHDVTWHDGTWRDMTWRDMTMKLTIKHWSCDRRASFRAIAYKFRAFLSRNECCGNFENLLNRKMIWIFEVPQTWLLCRNISNGFFDPKNLNSQEISKIYKTHPPVPPSTPWTGKIPGFSRLLKHGSPVEISAMDSLTLKTKKMLKLENP